MGRRRKVLALAGAMLAIRRRATPAPVLAPAPRRAVAPAPSPVVRTVLQTAVPDERPNQQLQERIVEFERRHRAAARASDERADGLAGELAGLSSQIEAAAKRAAEAVLLAESAVECARSAAGLVGPAVDAVEGRAGERHAQLLGRLSAAEGALADTQHRLPTLLETVDMRVADARASVAADLEGLRQSVAGVVASLPDAKEFRQLGAKLAEANSASAAEVAALRQEVARLAATKTTMGGGGLSSRQQMAISATVVEKSADFTIPDGAGRYIVLADASAGAVQITLPTAAGRLEPYDVTVIRKNVGGSNVTVVPKSGQKICGDTGGLVLNAARTGNTAAVEFTPIVGGWWIT